MAHTVSERATLAWFEFKNQADDVALLSRQSDGAHDENIIKDVKMEFKEPLHVVWYRVTNEDELLFHPFQALDGRNPEDVMQWRTTYTTASNRIYCHT